VNLVHFFTTVSFGCLLGREASKTGHYKSKPAYSSTNHHNSRQLNIEHHNCSKIITSHPQRVTSILRKLKYRNYRDATKNSLCCIVAVIATTKFSRVWVQDGIDEVISCPLP
jgi:hypothetical protein